MSSVAWLDPRTITRPPPNPRRSEQTPAPPERDECDDPYIPSWHNDPV